MNPSLGAHPTTAELQKKLMEIENDPNIFLEKEAVQYRRKD
jgi:hypothetical protein